MQQLLLIDDDVELCELLGAWLSQEGYQVFYAHSTQHARHLYERLGFIQLGTIKGGFRMKNGHFEDICPYYRKI